MDILKSLVYLKFIVMEKVFDNIPLSFTFHGQEIHGILEGSFQVWTFNSGSEAFTRIIPLGKLYNNAKWVEPIRYEALDLYQAICRAGEEMGLRMEKREE